MKKLIASILAALSIGVVASQASATIGPYGGRIIDAIEPYKSATYEIDTRLYAEGTGGQQWINVRMMVFYGGTWNQHGATQTVYLPSGTQNNHYSVYHSCSSFNGATYPVRTEVKWSSWSWSQGDKSASRNLTC